MTAFAMLISVYNTLSSAAKGWKLSMPFLDFQVIPNQYPHVLGPVAYTVSIIIWIISLNIGFTSEFYAGFGFYLADFSTAASYGIAIHYTIFSRLLQEKESENVLIP